MSFSVFAVKLYVIHVGYKETYQESNLLNLFTISTYYLLTQYCAGDKIEKNEMGWACGAYGWR